jgi:hypothetical protein
MAKAKEEQKEISQTMRKSYGSFKELSDQLNGVPLKKVDKVSFLIDKLTLEPTTYDELLKKIEENRNRLKTKDFKTLSRIKAHISHRQKNNGFKYAFDEVKGSLQLVGVDQK